MITSTKAALIFIFFIEKSLIVDFKVSIRNQAVINHLIISYFIFSFEASFFI